MEKITMMKKGLIRTACTSMCAAVVLLGMVACKAEPDVTSPAEVTSLTATSGNAQVTLCWTNPADSDFSKAMVEYATTAVPSTVLCTYEVAGTAGAAGTYTVTGLTNGTSYTFTVYTQDGTGNRSGGVSVKATAK